MNEITDLEQQDKEFRFLLSKITHEIRNPLTLVSSELQILASGHPELESYPGWEDILTNLEYIRNLLTDLSAYQNARKLNLSKTDTAALFCSITGSFRPVLDYLGITFETEIPDTLPVLSLDQIKIRQALLNLLQNAQEALPPSGGKITFSVSAVTGGISLSISDNGCGIPKEQQKDILLPFVTFRQGGTGLGLPITLQIIRAHQGTLEISSIPGKGSTFQIFLPLLRG